MRDRSGPAANIEQDYDVSSSMGSEDLPASSDSYARVTGCELSADGFVLILEVGLRTDRVRYRDVTLELSLKVVEVRTAASGFTSSPAGTDATLAGRDDLSRSMVSPKDNDEDISAPLLPPLYSRLSDSVPALGKDSAELKFTFNPHAPTFVPPSVSCPAPDSRQLPCTTSTPLLPQAIDFHAPLRSERPQIVPCLMAGPASRQHPRTRTPARPNAKSLLLTPSHVHNRVLPSHLAHGLSGDPLHIERYKRICHWRGTAMAAARRRRKRGESAAGDGGVAAEAEAECEAERIALEMVAMVVDADEDEHEGAGSGWYSS